MELYVPGTYSATQSIPKSQISSEFAMLSTLSEECTGNTNTVDRVTTAVSGKNVYVVWRDNDQETLMYSLERVQMEGVNFDPSKNLSNSPGFSGDAKIAVSGENVYVIWTDDTAGNNEVFVWNDNTASPVSNIEIFFRASLTSLTPPEAIQNLIQTVINLDHVNFRIETALTTQLRIALIFASDSNPSNDFISCAIMDRFSASVNILATRGLLTTAQATDLLQQAQQVRNIIGCSGTT